MHEYQAAALVKPVRKYTPRIMNINHRYKYLDLETQQLKSFPEEGKFVYLCLLVRNHRCKCLDPSKNSNPNP